MAHTCPSMLEVRERWVPEAEARGLRIVRTQDLIATLRCRESQPLVVSACIGPDCPPPPSC
jgi:hypothetical protein